jgi:pimeloyl-ACP methyl ester carboxylesterase
VTNKAVGAIIAAVLVVAGCSSDGGADPDGADPSTLVTVEALEWTPCTWEDAPPEPFECAEMTAPLDYDDRDGETITLSLMRHPAQFDDSRGAILVNPGGPGASGIDFVSAVGEMMAYDVGLEEFDIVGFDPRGVGRSSGIRCLDDATIDKYQFPDYTPDTADEEKLLEESRTVLIEACVEEYGDALRHYSTLNTARDMDLMRRAMGLDAIGYIGVSYGTYLGGVYATLFPDNLTAAYLDAAFDPQGDSADDELLIQAEGFENALDNWIEWCEESSGCPFAASDVGARFDALYERLDASPVEAPDGRLGNQAVMGVATVSALYSQQAWPTLAGALAAAEGGDASGIFSLADSYNDRQEDGTYLNSDQASRVIRCASGLNWSTPDDPEALVERLLELAPRYGRDATPEDFSVSYCDGLMERPEIFEVDYSGSAPVVVVGGTEDPATPFRWSEEMVDNLGDAAVLVTFEGEGHGQILGSSCVNDVVAALFVDETVPEPDTVCRPDPDVERPAWWGKVPAVGSDETALDAAVVGPAIGLPPSDAYAEYRAVDDDAESVFDRYRDAIVAAGLEPESPDIAYEAGMPAFFAAGDEYLGLYILDEAEIAETVVGLVPSGSVIVVLYFFPQ